MIRHFGANFHVGGGGVGVKDPGPAPPAPGLLLIEEADVPEELEEELELELELELQLILAVLTGAYVGVRRARMDNGAYFLATSRPRCPDQKHFTTCA